MRYPYHEKKMWFDVQVKAHVILDEFIQHSKYKRDTRSIGVALDVVSEMVYSIEMEISRQKLPFIISNLKQAVILMFKRRMINEYLFQKKLLISAYTEYADTSFAKSKTKQYIDYYENVGDSERGNNAI